MGRSWYKILTPWKTHGEFNGVYTGLLYHFSCLLVVIEEKAPYQESFPLFSDN